ncbi:shufflon system plasmid conjugative transfer pilus tip adhesin PilV, partial [Methylobacterium hispanicum]
MSIRSIQKEPLRLLHRLRRRKRGLTLIEVAGALGIVAVAGVGFAQMAADSQLATKDKATAVRLKEVTDAATAYVRSNYPQIVAVAPLNAPIQIGIVAGEGAAGGLQDLQSAGFLGSSFQNRNAYNQQHAVQVIKRAPAAVGGPERLEILVNTYGGNAISDSSLPRVATLVGAEGGYIPQAASAYTAAGTVQGNIIGAY